MDEPAKTSSAMMVMGCTWLMFMIILTTYTGNLVGFLTVTLEKLPVNNLQELAEQNTHTVGVLGRSSHEALFRVLFIF